MLTVPVRGRDGEDDGRWQLVVLLCARRPQTKSASCSADPRLFRSAKESIPSLVFFCSLEERGGSCRRSSTKRSLQVGFVVAQARTEFLLLIRPTNFVYLGPVSQPVCNRTVTGQDFRPSFIRRFTSKATFFLHCKT
jgi:hypothetical protein